MITRNNARLTYLRRLEMVQDITERGLSASQAGAAHGVSAVTAREWLGRYLASGAAGLCDKSSRPACSPRAISPATALAIVALRRQELLVRPLRRAQSRRDLVRGTLTSGDSGLAVDLKSKGGAIDAVSGATISSTATVGAVQKAAAQYQAIKAQIVETWK